MLVAAGEVAEIETWSQIVVCPTMATAPPIMQCLPMTTLCSVVAMRSWGSLGSFDAAGAAGWLVLEGLVCLGVGK